MDNNNVVEPEVNDVPAVVPDDQKTMITEKYVESAAKQIEIRSRLLMTALKAVKPHDFQDFENKPYLEGEGAARIMAVVRGFKVGEARFNVEQIAPHYFIECAIPIEFMGATTVAIGDCSTADSFFAFRVKKYTEQTASETLATRLMLGDAKKKARENAISRGVSELLGIKGLTWDDLAQLGFSKEKAGSQIKFKQGANGIAPKNKVLTIEEACLIKAGSVINVKGKVVNVKERTVGSNKTITDYFLEDNKAKIKISAWGSCIDGLKENSIVFADNVSVTVFQGANQYMAREISIVESEVSKGGDDVNA